MTYTQTGTTNDCPQFIHKLCQIGITLKVLKLRPETQPASESSCCAMANSTIAASNTPARIAANDMTLEAQRYQLKLA